MRVWLCTNIGSELLLRCAFKKFTQQQHPLTAFAFSLIDTKLKKRLSTPMCSRRWHELYGRWRGLHKQGHLEARTVSDLCVWQRSGPLWWNPVRWADKLWESGHPWGRVLPCLPDWFSHQQRDRHFRWASCCSQCDCISTPTFKKRKL